MKRIWMVLIAACFLFLAGICPAKEQAVDMGNKVCPVSGENIDERTKSTYEYNGKIYNFCCSSCIPAFKKYPEKYIEIVSQEKAR